MPLMGVLDVLMDGTNEAKLFSAYHLAHGNCGSHPYGMRITMILICPDFVKRIRIGFAHSKQLGLCELSRTASIIIDVMLIRRGIYPCHRRALFNTQRSRTKGISLRMRSIFEIDYHHLR